MLYSCTRRTGSTVRYHTVCSCTVVLLILYCAVCWHPQLYKYQWAPVDFCKTSTVHTRTGWAERRKKSSAIKDKFYDCWKLITVLLTFNLSTLQHQVVQMQNNGNILLCIDQQYSTVPYCTHSVLHSTWRRSSASTSALPLTSAQHHCRHIACASSHI